MSFRWRGQFLQTPTQKLLQGWFKWWFSNHTYLLLLLLQTQQQKPIFHLPAFTAEYIILNLQYTLSGEAAKESFFSVAGGQGIKRGLEVMGQYRPLQDTDLF